MKTSLKILTIALLAAVVAGAFALYTPIAAADSTVSGDLDTQAIEGGYFASIEQADPPQHLRHRHKLELLRRLIANSEPTEVNGTVVALVKNMLVVNVDEGQVRVLMPPVWIVGEDVLRTQGLFDSGNLNVGDNVTIKALKTTLKEGEDEFSIYTLFGYEIINNANGVHAYAVLPFNIND